MIIYITLLLLDANKSIAPDYTVGWDFFDVMVKDHINQYNYTLNPHGIFNSIKFMYTYYPDPNNKTHIREEFVRVKDFNETFHLFSCI